MIEGPQGPWVPSPHPHLRFRFALPDWLKPGGGKKGPKSKPPSKPKNTKPKGGGKGFSKSR